MKDLLKDLLILLANPVLSKIHRYKNIHHGESCYLIGDGVSIKWFNLKNFSDKISISISLIPFHKEFNLLNVKYLLLIEPFWFYPSFWTKNITKSSSMPYIQKAYRNIIKENQEKIFFINLSNYPAIRSDNLIYLYRGIKDERLSENFISNLTNCTQSSLTASILIAIYLGFDHCYLVGCDYTHKPSRSLHFYEKGQGVFYEQHEYLQDFFEIAKEFIDITTITLDGTSDFINAVTYKEHTGIDPFFKENTELIDERYLKVLATWPGYSIF